MMSLTKLWIVLAYYIISCTKIKFRQINNYFLKETRKIFICALTDNGLEQGFYKDTNNHKNQDRVSLLCKGKYTRQMKIHVR